MSGKNVKIKDFNGDTLDCFLDTHDEACFRVVGVSGRQSAMVVATERQALDLADRIRKHFGVEEEAKAEPVADLGLEGWDTAQLASLANLAQDALYRAQQRASLRAKYAEACDQGDEANAKLRALLRGMVKP